MYVNKYRIFYCITRTFKTRKVIDIYRCMLYAGYKNKRLKNKEKKMIIRTKVFNLINMLFILKNNFRYEITCKVIVLLFTIIFFFSMYLMKVSLQKKACYTATNTQTNRNMNFECIEASYTSESVRHWNIRYIKISDVRYSDCY